MNITLTQVLLIEDNSADALLLSEALQQDPISSFEVTNVEHLKTAIHRLKEKHFDIVLLDLVLPDSQGLNTFIKIHQESPDTPVVILSGLMSEEIALQAIHLGAQDYLVKRQEAWEIAARTIRYAIERQRSRIALRDSENRFRNLFEHAPVAYLSLDLDGSYLDFNVHFLELLGYLPGELAGQSFIEQCSPETMPAFSRKFARFIQDGEINADIQLVKKDGSLIEVLMKGSVQYDADRQFVQTHSVLFDITARKLAEQALRETQERFSAVFRSNPLGISITELADGTIVDANESFLNMFGYTRGEILRRTPFELNIWQDPEEHTRNLKLLRTHGEVANTETRLRRKDGEIVHALASYRLIELNGKHFVLNMLNDITDRKEKEQALIDNERRFLALIENGLENISLLTSEGVLLWESPTVVRTLDYEPNTFVGQNILELLHPDDQAKISGQLAELLQQPGRRLRDEFRLRHSNGTWRWVEAVATNLLNEPNINAILVNYHDITDRKQAQESLLKSEQQYRSLFEDAPIAIWEEDFSEVKKHLDLLKRQGIADFKAYFASNPDAAAECARMIKVLDANNTAVQMYKAESKAQLIEHTGQNSSRGEIEHNDEDFIAIAAGRITNSWEGTDETFSGETIEIKLSWSVVPGHESDYSKVLVTTIDITKLRRNELELKAKLVELAALYETTKDLSLELDVQKLLQQIVERTNKLLGSSGGFIYLHDQAQDDLVLTVASELGQPIGTRLKMGEGMAGQVALSRESLIVDDYQSWQSRVEIFADQPFHSVVEVPMLSGGELIGVLGVEQYEDPGRKFNEQDAHLLALFAGYAAGAVRNARLLSEANANAQQLSLLYDAGLVLNHELDAQIQLDLLFGIVQHALNADNAVFFRYDEIRGDLHIESGVGMAMDLAELKELRFKLGEEAGLVGLVAQNRVPLYLPDVRQDPRWIRVDSETHTGLWVPIEYEKRMVGVLSVSSTRLDAFSRQAQQLVVLFANQIAIAMENARLFDALQNELSERKQAERALLESESLYRRAIEVAGAVPYYESYYDNGKSIKYEFIGEGIRNLTGYGPEEFSANIWDSLVLDVHPVKDLAGYSLDEAIQRVRSGENPVWKCEHRIRHRSGDIRWIFEAAVELRDEDGVSHGSIGMYQDITESKQAEAALRRGEERYRGIFEGVQDAILVESTDGMILDVNQRACEMFGYSREEFLTKNVHDLIPAGRPAIADDEGGLEAISHGPVETVDIRANGEEFPVEISGRLYDFDGQKVFLVVLRDITERKQAEKAMRERDQSYKTLIDQTPAIVYIDDSSTDPGRTQFVSPYIQTMLGFTPEEWTKGGEALWKEQLHSEDRERVLAEYDRSIQTTAPLSLEYRIHASDGRVVWVHDQATTLRDEAGKPQAVHGVMYDITERKKSEEALQESEKRFSSAFAHAPIGMALVALDGHWLKTNQALSELTGFTEPELLQKTFQDITHPDDLEADLSYVKQLLMGEIRSYQMEKRYIHKNGKIVWVLLSVSLILDRAGRPLYFIAQIQDITQRRESQMEINHQLSELEALYENGLAISRMLEPKQIARRIVQVLDQKLKWHHAAVRILRPESGQLELLALSQPGLDEIQINQQIERVNRFNINLDYGLSGWVVKHRKAFRSGNLKQNPNYVETYPGIKSGLYVPIRSGEEIIGSIAVESEQEDAFAQSDERLLLTLANQAAISFVNARLYERLQIELIERRRTEDQILKLNVELEQRVQERTREIEMTHQRLELAAASSGIGVWELKSGVDSLYWDERMHSIYGTRPERFTPTLQNWLGLVHPEDRAIEAEKTSRAIAQPGTYQSEFRIIREDGSIRYVNSHAMVLVDQQQQFKDMIGVHMDITTIKQAEETLRMANSELERALRVKDEFLANMSHELRTPLNAILGLSESLEEQIIGSLNEKQQRYIHTISESGHHLLTLINDILDLAKIEAGQIRLDINRVDIHAVCQSSLRMVKQLAQKKNQRVDFEIDEKLNLIWADERRLKQMMVNLLSNAVKFTADGGRIGLEVHANESDNQVVITVWDSGIGIKESDLLYLFRPFVQLDAGLARESPGTGLGLALVAQMARLHGGSVSATSQLGVGSRFTITLPWEPALASDTLSRMKITGKFRIVKPGSENNGQTILLVEDTEDVVMMLKDYLESAAYRVVTAQNGIEGIAQAKKFHPDLILMDVQMPGMDGLEATQRLRSERGFQNTPIIALTAFAMQNDRERCLAAGMNEYMSKPVNMKSLLKMVQSFLGSS